MVVYTLLVAADTGRVFMLLAHKGWHDAVVFQSWEFLLTVQTFHWPSTILVRAVVCDSTGQRIMRRFTR